VKALSQKALSATHRFGLRCTDSFSADGHNKPEKLTEKKLRFDILGVEKAHKELG
jgi:hypothetical protein